LVDEQMTLPAHRPFFEKMAACGVEIIAVALAPGGRMHNKCTVVDSRWVATGAANWTRQAFEANAEDVLLIESPDLAQRYLQRFDDLGKTGDIIQAPSDSMMTKAIPSMRTVARQGGRQQRSSAFQTVGGVGSVQVFFTPGTNGVIALLNQLGNATSSIDVGMYLLNYPLLVEKLADKAGECRIRLIVDRGMLGGGNEEVLRTLHAAGVQIKIYGGERISMHLKVAVIDRREVWTGSANWTTGAFLRNSEDHVQFNSPALAAHYAAYLDRLAAQAETYVPVEAVVLEENDKPQRGAVGHLPPTGPRTEYGSPVVEPFPAIPLRGQIEYLSDEQYLPALLRTVDGAKQSIFGTMFVFSEQKSDAPSQEAVLKALFRAVQRNVYVYLVLHVPESPGNALLETHSRRAEALRRQGLDVRLGRPERPMHAKLFVVDQSRILLGSHNWSEGSLSGKRVYETSLLIRLPQPDERLADYVLSRPVLSDMRSRDLWEAELSRLYRLKRLRLSERKQLIEEWTKEIAP